MPTQRIWEFDLWQAGYDAAVVTVYIGGTTTNAALFTDEALTVSASNPQTLGSRTINSISYGKFDQPLYTSSTYELSIDGTDQTGIQRPGITTFDDENASNSEVTPTGGSQANDLDDILGRVIHAEDHGVIGTVAATNNTTIVAAIAAATANGGGFVIFPGGTIPFTSFTLPIGVFLVGQGREVTVLQSQTNGTVITISGNRAGLIGLTLDGVDKQASSTGLYSKANDEIRLINVNIKRFATNFHCRGGRRHAYEELYIENAVTGVKWHGDNDASGGADGDEFRGNTWKGGRVWDCTTIGVQLSFVDKKCYDNQIADVAFDNNTGTALDINGARYTKLPGCSWSGNTTDLAVNDDSDTDSVLLNTVIGLHLDGGSMSGGAVTFAGTCQDTVIEQMEIADVDFTLTLPKNNIIVKDCTEDSLVTIAGNGERYQRQRTSKGDAPGSSGTTTDAVATKAWAYRLLPGEVGIVRAMVVGVQQDGTGYAIYHIAQGCRRPGSTLAYDSQTANFTLGQVVTGTTSGATGLIVADADSGATGTLTLITISGEFVNNETITDPLGGSALANGVMAHQASAVLGSITDIQTPVESDINWACIFVSAGDGGIEVHVTGAASITVAWVVHGEVVAA